MSLALQPSKKSCAMIRKGALHGLEALTQDFKTSAQNIPRQINPLHSLAANEETFISLAEYETALEKSAHTVKDTNFGFVFGMRFDTRMLGPSGYAFQLAPTLGDALQLFCDNFSGVQSDTMIRLQVSGHITRLLYSVQSPVGRQDTETSLGILLGACARVCGEKWKCNKISFEHDRVGDDSLKTVLTGRQPEYLKETNALYFDACLLSTPIPTHDPYLYSKVKTDAERMAKDIVHEVEFTASVADILNNAMSRGLLPTLDLLANELGMSKRSIQKKFEMIGTNFRTEKKEALMKRAQYLLSCENTDVTNIALQLGYSETSAFSRAYRKHFGKSPSNSYKSIP